MKQSDLGFEHAFSFDKKCGLITKASSQDEEDDEREADADDEDGGDGEQRPPLALARRVGRRRRATVLRVE